MTSFAAPTGARYVALHALQPFADTLLNRDKSGGAKILHYGDAPRTRVSSQSWNRQVRHLVRQALKDRQESSVVVTVMLPQEIATILVEQYGVSVEEATGLGGVAVSALGIKTSVGARLQTKATTVIDENTASRMAAIVFKYRSELAGEAAKFNAARRELAAKEAQDKAKKQKTEQNVIEETTGDEDKGEIKEVQATFSLKKIAPNIKSELRAALDSEGAIDLALFGRFLAEVEGGSVTTSVRTPDSFTVSPHVTSNDFFTVVDDVLEAAGVDVKTVNMQTQPFTGGLFYRHAVLDRYQLRRNLEDMGLSGDALDKATKEAETLFVDAWINAVPSSKQTRSGSNVLPTFILQTASDKQPVNASPAFEHALDSSATSVEAIERMGSYLKRAWTFRPIVWGKAVYLGDDKLAYNPFGDAVVFDLDS